jgi:AcrR family transcriptional regulator
MDSDATPVEEVTHARERASSRRSATADRLLEAAIGAIDTGGEAAVRVQEVADAAGVQIPILYRQFGSRDGLIQAAQVERLSRTLGREMDDLASAMDAVATAEEFRALIDAVMEASQRGR